MIIEITLEGALAPIRITHEGTEKSFATYYKKVIVKNAALK